MRINWLLSPLYFMLIGTAIGEVRIKHEQRDAREGDKVNLACRFDLKMEDVDLLPEKSPTYYWTKNSGSENQIVALGNIPLDKNYHISHIPEKGQYDLLISNISYERDNGWFECHYKAAYSGDILHEKGYILTVLTQPQGPSLSPAGHAHAQEGKEMKLSCSSSGGSPEPNITWYRDGSPYPLEVSMTHGKDRTEPSVATLTLTPKREDDGATFRCVVWNRAMPEGQQLDATVELDVNYYPRVEIGPENPLKVEIDGTATMECKVDAKPKVSSVRWTRNGKYISNFFTQTIKGVTVQDAGKYTCTADNNLGRPGEKEIYLDVLFPPIVTVESKTYETEEGGTVEIRCDVSANPEPISVEWTMEGKPEFHQTGNILLLTRVNADMVGTYTCKAINVISSTTGKLERSSSASVAILVRHKPGRALINPDSPVVHEGAGVTLTCNAKPPGWPIPQYRWYRDIDSSDSKPIVVATGNKYTISSAHLGSEGTYYCQATNELGHGELASATLEIHQPPRFQSKLQPHITKRSGEQNFLVSCSALGKPQPNIKWYKDNSEIKPDTDMYEVKSDITKGRNSIYTVQSTLKFNGKARPNSNDLFPEDRGIYSCTFENEVKKIESSMQLRIEHAPLLIRPQKKVAYDVMETAKILCRVEAYPKPEFQWFYGSTTTPLQTSVEDHYTIDTTTDHNDSYLSKLIIKNVKSQDYGEYYCNVKNSLGTIRTQFRLQPKGAPESPRFLASQAVGSSYVTLKWEPGFDGGLSSTKYFVRYRSVSGRAGVPAGARCPPGRAPPAHWMEYDCGRDSTCNVTKLDQQNSYTFQVKAVNTKGQSEFSYEITVTTKADEIPPPEHVTFDPSTKAITFSVGPTCMSLLGVVEGLGGDGGWQVVDTVPISFSGVSSTIQEATLDLPTKSNRRANDRTLDELNPRIRLKLCLEVSKAVCSTYTEAEIGPAFIKEASALTTATLIAIIVSSLVFLLFLSLLFIFCKCKRNQNKMETSKDYELEMTPSMVTPQNQAPPPYYPSAGMENKALEHSMDLALSMDDANNAEYATQGGYGYHISPHAQGHAVQNMNGSEWVPMRYLENSYTNSNNGGSVNSQDSLWQIKMAAAGVAAGAPERDGYDYDPVAHGGYGPEDYLPYPQPADYALRSSQNPSRQDYCSDPYASVHKPKKRMDQHIEPPYHEVSGVPAGAPPAPPAPPTLGYDDSLESGYSTPNSRARRVIREIIV